MQETDPSERKLAYQESVNKKVLLEWVRVTGMSNPKKKNYDRLLQELAHDIIRFPKENGSAFMWPTSAGISNGIQAIRAKISYSFWKFFISEGRNSLMEYNKKNNVDIKISREQTLQVSDMEKLGLYLRKFIREAHVEAHRRCPEISYKKGMLSIGKEHNLTPTMAAFLYDINMDEWRGLPIEELMSAKEKESIQNGEHVRGSLRMTGVNLSKPLKRGRAPEDMPSTSGIQAASENNENQAQKRPLCLDSNEENPNKLTKN